MLVGVSISAGKLSRPTCEINLSLVLIKNILPLTSCTDWGHAHLAKGDFSVIQQSCNESYTLKSNPQDRLSLLN